MGSTQRIARFVAGTAGTAAPEIARMRAAAAIADGIAVGFAGGRTDGARAMVQAFRATGELTGRHQLLGTGHRATSSAATSFNGFATHSIEFDDTIHPGPLHPSCHLVPVILAIAEDRLISGRDAVEAFLIGAEVEAKVSRSLNPEHFAKGWHPTGTIGALGATATAARLLRLDESQVGIAIGIAASRAAGLRANTGYWTKPLHAGTSATTGVLAATLADAGWHGGPELLDGEWGYLTLHSAADVRDELIGELGTEWEMATKFGLGLKPYPCCGEGIGALEAGLLLSNEVKVSAVERIEVYTSSFAFTVMSHPAPGNSDEARFSMPFCVAGPLALGRGGLDLFTEDALADPAVQELMAKVTHLPHEAHRAERDYGALVRVIESDGRVVVKEIERVKGWGDRWLSEAEREGKVRMCLASAGVYPDNIDWFWNNLKQLDRDEPFPEIPPVAKEAEDF